ncbi:pyridoxal-phosphate dependent enzyme [Xenorhabdus nematophila]|uniref:pyridoxal-phosphate dependent enzyme n=1 Tax=Xenorhabdus nematophila TaxID=628 RepID=UPI0005429B1E|nr:pyridoxal-phosphate dependent enzyme [Xenorhabdus nematophila]CEF30876.1 Cysteine synthase [Xenorhabdus nematophila str. Websteri]AYA40921.1 pyridoxal-phosphate dependent enzyme [Xenorhabdus nematophila]KHD28547.1 cystathionine beta-synthase [Xenorhabdus nematophila]MBA0019670.1 pyridoxal-phosphate dependent enzyme [Xenorhabdus nematophila]MCB4424027.1 pyridoxal-phosphate dependent enzyme [Xenorhabdus nematophila]
MAAPRSVLELIGNTPLLELTHLDTGPCQLFIKLENQNPGGSIKDRVALSMIEQAEKQGLLKPGGTIIEATAGNTGIGLALVAAMKGYKLILVVPDKMSREKIYHLRALGTEVRLTRSDVVKGHPEYYQDHALRLSQEISGAYYIDQFSNPANSAAHTLSTGPEIWQQMEKNVDAMVVGVGSGGTLGGLSQYFKGVSPQTEFVLADPKGSILADYVEHGHYDEAGSWFVEGIGEDFVPPLGDFSRVHHAYRITDAEAFSSARELLLEEGILAGSSSGTLLAAALRYCRAQTTPKRVVTFACDSGNKYLSKMFNDYWLLEQGLRSQPQENNLTDYITYRYREGATVSVSPQDTLQIAYGRMRLYDISQLPVLENDQVVGIIDEWDLMHTIKADSQNFSLSVTEAMTSQVRTLNKKAPLAQLIATFDAGHVALIVDDDNQFLGLVTRTDVLNVWRQQLN